MALGFQLGTLNPNDTATIDVLLSDDGSSISSFSLRHADLTSSDTLTLSGQATVTSVPEPGGLTLLGTGSLGLLAYGLLPWRRSAND